MKDTSVRTVVWVLLAAWALFSVLFALKLRSAFDHPLAKPNPGGLLFLIGQVSLGAALVIHFRDASN